MNGSDDLDKPLKYDRLFRANDAFVFSEFLDVCVNIPGITVFHQNAEMTGTAIFASGFCNEVFFVRDDVRVVDGLEEGYLVVVDERRDSRDIRSEWMENILSMFAHVMLNGIMMTPSR